MLVRVYGSPEDGETFQNNVHGLIVQPPKAD